MTAATAIKASCDRTYHASRSSGVRDPAVISFVTIHSEEAGTALSAASWFANPRPCKEDGPCGSAHQCIDDKICYRTLRDTEIPWAAASAPEISANLHGIHVELAGFARWKGTLWLLHRPMLRRAAFKTAEHCARYGIPARFLFAADLVAGERHGITTHVEITKASKVLDRAHASRYDHTDPGLFWPRRYFMRLVREYLDELTLDYRP